LPTSDSYDSLPSASSSVCKHFDLSGQLGSVILHGHWLCHVNKQTCKNSQHKIGKFNQIINWFPDDFQKWLDPYFCRFCCFEDSEIIY
jgi:hypothetical protein